MRETCIGPAVCTLPVVTVNAGGDVVFAALHGLLSLPWSADTPASWLTKTCVVERDHAPTTLSSSSARVAPPPGILRRASLTSLCWRVKESGSGPFKPSRRLEHRLQHRAARRLARKRVAQGAIFQQARGRVGARFQRSVGGTLRPEPPELVLNAPCGILRAGRELMPRSGGAVDGKNLRGKSPYELRRDIGGAVITIPKHRSFRGRLSEWRSRADSLGAPGVRAPRGERWQCALRPPHHTTCFAALCC